MGVAVVVIVLALVACGLIGRWFKRATVLDKAGPIPEPIRRDADQLAHALDQLVDNLTKVSQEGAAIRDQFKGVNNT